MYAVILGKGKGEAFLVSDACAEMCIAVATSSIRCPAFIAMSEAIHEAAQLGLVNYTAAFSDDICCLLWPTRALRNAIIKQLPDDVLHKWLKEKTAACSPILSMYVAWSETVRTNMLETICQLDAYVDETERVNENLQHKVGQLERENVTLTDTVRTLEALLAKKDKALQDKSLFCASCPIKYSGKRADKREVGRLTRELDQVKAEYAWLSSRTSNNKEPSAMKINLEMKDVTCGGNVVISSFTVNAEASDEMLVKCYDTFATFTKALLNPPKSTCTCRDGNEDKRPSAIVKPRAKGNHENAFMPSDME